jgi:uncharacterized protein (TIGR02145 family)
MISSILDFSRSVPNKGMLFDTRDGQSYQVVRINNQIWLAENFRYLPSKEKGDKYENSWVYENNNDYLDLHYGRLYDWNTAMNIAPEGWRLPSNEDFIELIDFIKKDNNLGDEKVGSYLKSVNGWASSFRKIKPNNDKYGFNAKPAGIYSSRNDYFSSVGYYADFWSATEEKDNRYVSNRNLRNRNEDFNTNCGSYKFHGFSVRLIKNK